MSTSTQITGLGSLIGVMTNSCVDTVSSSGTLKGSSGSNYGIFAVGGLVGEAMPLSAAGGNPNVITRSTTNVEISVTGSSSPQAGGLLGISGGRLTVSRCSASGNITVENGIGVGGLIGQTLGTGEIRFSHATGNVAGAMNLGGFVGNALSQFVGYTILVRESYSTGNVTLDNTGDSDGSGGFIGSLTGKVINSYSRGNVTGPVCTRMGGFIGNIGYAPIGSLTVVPAEVSFSYSTGKVTTIGSSSCSTMPAPRTPGGFIQILYYQANTDVNLPTTAPAPDPDDAFWDSTTSGISSSYYSNQRAGAAHTTSWLKTKSNFTAAGWDFTNIWDITTGNYPTLRNQ